jgi:alpha-L-arabinofuranosidase
MNEKSGFGYQVGKRFLNRLLTGFILLAVWYSGATILKAQTANSMLTVDLTKPGHQISPILYNGELFEEIGRGIDGGFYAQLISNYSFEDNNPLDSWYLVNPGSVRGAIFRRTKTDVYYDLKFDPQRASRGALYALTSAETAQLNSNQYHCLKLDITSVGSGSVGAANTGYWGIRLDNNTTYKVSFFARKDDNFDGTITVKLESNDGQVYASSEPVTPTQTWQKYTCDLVTSGISGVSGSNRFVLYGSTTGSLYFDVVRVMPPTYKDRPNGMRIDMANLQAALKPKFIRFPGGCDVEHSSVEKGWNWKKAIGPIEQRPGTYEQRWGYHNSQQFGLDDFFQMCEDWGAEPVYCPSMSLAEGYGAAPLDQMQPFIDDLLDLIEYANGDAQTSKWGRLRAENGHPEPYNLKYIEVGNENGRQKGYMERYALFYDAIKKNYPGMNVIIDDILGDQKADMIDEHFYRNFEQFLKLSTHYDNYDRNGPKIVVGEYSDKENRTEVGNLLCAIGEAAFLTGCERNSDIVISTAYGTLSENVNLDNWFPNLYYNNCVTCFAIPSYYMEKMFVENTGDYILPYTLNGSLYVAPSRVKNNGDVIIKVVNATGEITNTRITLTGAPENLKTMGTATTLTSGSTSDENSIAHPTKVVPATNTFAAGSRFNYTFPANSVTVLRIGVPASASKPAM